jgi:hypothetical protein
MSELENPKESLTTPTPSPVNMKAAMALNVLVGIAQITTIILSAYWVISSRPIISYSSAPGSTPMLVDGQSHTMMQTGAVQAMTRSNLMAMLDEGDTFQLNSMEHITFNGPPAGSVHMFKVLGYSWYNTSSMDVYLTRGVVAHVTPTEVNLITAPADDEPSRRKLGLLGNVNTHVNTNSGNSNYNNGGNTYNTNNHNTYNNYNGCSDCGNTYNNAGRQDSNTYDGIDEQ